MTHGNVYSAELLCPSSARESMIILVLILSIPCAPGLMLAASYSRAASPAVICRGSTGHAASIAGAVASMPQAASGSPAPGSGSLRLPPSTPGGTPLQMHQRIALMQQFLNHRLNPSASSGGNGGANIFTANSKAAPQLGANGKGPVDQVSTMRLTTQATRLLRHLQS
jgi:hypothetical protein